MRIKSLMTPRVLRAVSTKYVAAHSFEPLTYSVYGTERASSLELERIPARKHTDPNEVWGRRTGSTPVQKPRFFLRALGGCAYSLSAHI